MKKAQAPTVANFMAQYILLGGQVLSRSEAVKELEADNVDPRAYGWCIYNVTALTPEEVAHYQATLI